jgi:hypothetical protein
MPRIGLPAKALKAQRIGSSSSSSPMQMLDMALRVTSFRVISALVAAYSAMMLPRAAVETTTTTFGLYPVLTHQVDRWLGHWLASPVTPSLVVAWLACACAMVMLFRAAHLDLDGDKAEGAVLLALVFPFASVLGRSDADAMFLLFAIGAFYGFRQQMWIVGGLSGAAATATLPTGIFILPALAWIGFRQSGARRSRVVVSLLLAAAGFGACMAYMYYRGGPAGGWADAMNRWGYHLGQAPWLSLQHMFTSHPAPIDALNGSVALIALASVPIVWWRLDGGYAIYMLAMLWLPLTSGTYDDLGRTSALLFPLFILLAGIRWRPVFIAIVIASTMFYALALASGL